MLGVVSSIATVVITGIITVLAQAYITRQGRRTPERDGDVVVLRYGRGTRVGMVLVGLLVVTMFPGLMLLTGMQASPGYKAGLWVLIVLVTVLMTVGGVEVFRYRVFVTDQGLLVRGLRGERFVLFEEVVDIVDGRDMIRVRVVRGRAVSLSKSMPGWVEAERRVRAGWRKAQASAGRGV